MSGAAAKKGRFPLKAVLIALIALAVVFGLRAAILRWLFAPTGTRLESGVSRETADPAGEAIATVATGLDIPWEIVFLPEGDMLVTERPGTLRRVTGDGSSYPIEGVEHVGEGGLLGMALDPGFADNGRIYLYLTARTDGGLTNRIERYTLSDDALSGRTEILSGIPGAQYHDGGRLAFGPDGMLYATTGDAGNGDAAQDVNSLAGKILRMKPDGGVPEDNPFGSLVWSYGHRNPQGLAWDGDGNLWATEHGRSGLASGMDELNLIEPGRNYGWPVIEGDETAAGMVTPVINSGPDETWAPAGAAYAGDSVFFTGLRGESLYEARIADGLVTHLTAHLRGDFGRLRAVTVGPDGMLYVSTSNRDGRGAVREGDDRIIRIDPTVFRTVR